MKLILSFLAGGLFAVGLAFAGMTRPSKVVGFLDLTGDWDPSLAFVMVGAIAVYAVAYRLVAGRGRPLLDEKLHLPTRKDVDARLVGGAVLFGVGWGLAGYCPGPGLVASGTGAANALLFVASMLVGMTLFRVMEQRLARSVAAK